MINLSRLSLVNKALRLVGDYNLNTAGLVSSLGVYSLSLVRSSVFLVYSNLYSRNNYISVSLTGVPLVGDYYQYTIPNTTKLTKPQAIIVKNSNGDVIRTLNFTDLLRRESQGIFITDGSSVILNIHKDFVTAPTVIGDLVFTYFYEPNIDAPVADDSATIPFDEMVLECVAFKAATGLAMYLANDVNLNQLYENQYKELLATLQSNRDLGYGRPYYAKFLG